MLPMSEKNTWSFYPNFSKAKVTIPLLIKSILQSRSGKPIDMWILAEKKEMWYLK